MGATVLTSPEAGGEPGAATGQRAGGYFPHEVGGYPAIPRDRIFFGLEIPNNLTPLTLNLTLHPEI